MSGFTLPIEIKYLKDAITRNKFYIDREYKRMLRNKLYREECLKKLEELGESYDEKESFKEFVKYTYDYTEDIGYIEEIKEIRESVKTDEDTFWSRYETFDYVLK